MPHIENKEDKDDWKRPALYIKDNITNAPEKLAGYCFDLLAEGKPNGIASALTLLDDWTKKNLLDAWRSHSKDSKNPSHLLYLYYAPSEQWTQTDVDLAKAISKDKNNPLSKTIAFRLFCKTKKQFKIDDKEEIQHLNLEGETLPGDEKNRLVFGNAKLEMANFRQANLHTADLSKANIRYANLQDATLAELVSSKRDYGWMHHGNRLYGDKKDLSFRGVITGTEPEPYSELCQKTVTTELPIVDDNTKLGYISVYSPGENNANRYLQYLLRNRFLNQAFNVMCETGAGITDDVLEYYTEEQEDINKLLLYGPLGELYHYAEKLKDQEQKDHLKDLVLQFKEKVDERFSKPKKSSGEEKAAQDESLVSTFTSLMDASLVDKDRMPIALRILANIAIALALLTVIGAIIAFSVMIVETESKQPHARPSSLFFHNTGSRERVDNILETAKRLDEKSERKSLSPNKKSNE